MRVEKRNRKFGSFFGNHLSGSFIMSVAKEFTTDRNTDVKTAGNRVIEGCNYLQFFENRRRGAVRRRHGQRPSGAGKAAGTSRQ